MKTTYKQDCCHRDSLHTRFVSDANVNSRRLENISEVNAVYFPPKIDSDTLVVFLPGGTQLHHTKNYGWLHRVDRDYGFIEMEHYDHTWDDTRWSFADEVVHSIQGFSERNMNDDIRSIVYFIEQVYAMRHFRNTFLVGHSMGTNIAGPILYPQLYPATILGIATGSWETRTVSEMYPVLERLRSMISKVLLYEVYDMSSLSISASRGPEYVGLPYMPFVYYACAHDHYLPYTGTGANILQNRPLLGNSTNPSGKNLLDAVIYPSSEVNVTKHDFIPHEEYNAHLRFGNDLVDNAETEIYTLEYPNGVRGKFILTGREHMENGGPNLCAHGWTDMETEFVVEIKDQLFAI